MSHDPQVETFRIGNVPVSAVDMAGMVRSVARHLARGRAAPGTFVVFRDAHGVVRSQDDARLAAAHEDALLVCPDGRPLAWVGRSRGFQSIAQVPGIESVETICQAGVEAGWAHYFLGGGPGIAERLAATMIERVPGLKVAGTESPPYRALDADETAQMRARVRDSGAHIVWIGLGTPKQELFMAEHAPHLPGTVAMGVGAAFDVNIGTIPRAPRVFQVTGMEWAYRLWREPRRLWSRYSTVVPRFIRIVLNDARSRKAAAAPSNVASR